MDRVTAFRYNGRTYETLEKIVYPDDAQKSKDMYLTIREYISSGFYNDLDIPIAAVSELMAIMQERLERNGLS